MKFKSVFACLFFILSGYQGSQFLGANGSKGSESQEKKSDAPAADEAETGSTNCPNNRNEYNCPEGQFVRSVKYYEGTAAHADAIDNIGIKCGTVEPAKEELSFSTSNVGPSFNFSDTCGNETGVACPVLSTTLDCPDRFIMSALVYYEGVAGFSDSADALGALCESRGGAKVGKQWLMCDSESGDSCPSRIGGKI